MDTIFESLRPLFKGELDASEKTLAFYSHDASLFEIKPCLVVFPKDGADIEALVSWVNAHKAEDPTLSITARSGGTDMTGGSIGASIIVDFSRHMNRVISASAIEGIVEPGCFYRDFEKETLKHGSLMPTYPASREICALGGMVANNCGGEKSLRWGKIEDFVTALDVVFSDGKTYTVRALSKEELDAKIATTNFDGGLYRSLKKLIDDNYETIMAGKPDVSKNSAGYYLWNVYDRATGRFNLPKLIVGSQGTLGLVTKITLRLVPAEPVSSMLVVYMPSLAKVSEVINSILPEGPESIESYDDYSMKLAFKFFFDFFKQLGFIGAIKLGLQFIPDGIAVVLSGKLPKLILMVECTGKSQAEVKAKLLRIRDRVLPFGFKIRVARSSAEADKYWRIRRESFNLLRKHVKGLRTAPFIDDIVVKPEFLPEVLPKVQAMIDRYKLVYTVAGHPGNGNFHIIPLMDLKSPYSAETILDLSKEVYDLVLSHKGSITAEHNDGIIRTPYLPQMFGDELVHLFGETKKIFDPANIFNPGKKVGGTFEDIKNAIKKS